MTNPIIISRQRKNKDGREGTVHYYFCQGCKHVHGIAIRPHTADNGAGWEFSGSLEFPTYSPSQLIKFDGPSEHFVCHTFIREGKIEYLGDCTHELKNQTLLLQPLPDWFCQT